MSSLLQSSHKRKATTLGKRTALEHIFDGATEPREGVLSGEWADELTPYSLCEAVEFPHWDEVEDVIDADDHSELVADLCEIFEKAYNAKFAQVEECIHVFVGRGTPRSWGVTDKSRCKNCGVHVLSGSTLI